MTGVQTCALPICAAGWTLGPLPEASDRTPVVSALATDQSSLAGSGPGFAALRYDESSSGIRLRIQPVRGHERASTDKGIGTGECPADGPNQHPPGAAPPPWTLGNYLEFATSNGYAGAWGWSFSGSDHYGRLVPEALADFARRNPGLVNPRALL